MNYTPNEVAVKIQELNDKYAYMNSIEDISMVVFMGILGVILVCIIWYDNVDNRGSQDER